MKYRDVIVEGCPADANEHAPPTLPADYRGAHISCIPRIPLPNGSYLFYIRAQSDLIDRIDNDPRISSSIVAHSWTELFYSNYQYWDWVFDAEVTEQDAPTSYRVRRKLAEIGEREIHGIYVPGVFSGDDAPELRAPQFVLEHYRRFLANTKLVTPTLSALLDRLRSDPKQLLGLNSREFEEVICEILARFGWRVDLTPKSNDGGYDIFAISGAPGGVESSWLIECKRYKPECKVGVEIVRSICGVKEQLKAANAMIVTTSSFTRGANAWRTARLDLELRDYHAIVEWLRAAP